MRVSAVSSWGHRARAAWAEASAGARVARKLGRDAVLRPGAVAAALREGVRGRGIPSWLRFHAANTPDRIALTAKDRDLTFADLDREVEAVARGWLEAGLRRGDAVLLLLRNRPELVVAQLAAARLGNRVVSGSWRSTPRELAHLAEHSRARGIVLETTLVPAWSTVGPNPRSAGRVYTVGGPSDDGDTAPFAALRHAAPASARPMRDATLRASVVMYTSGTTGVPKGAVRRLDRGTAAPMVALFDRTTLGLGQTHITVCPLHHATAMGFSTLALGLGGRVVLLEGPFDPGRFFEAMARHPGAHTAVVPVMLRGLVTFAEGAASSSLARPRAIFCGGAPLPGPLARRAIAAFGPILFNFYGATETALVSLADSHDLLAAPGTIGRALPGNEVRLLGPDGREVPDGEVGELFVRSDNLVDGYDRDRAATAAAMRDGFFSVGDLARRDARGYLFLEGRRHDVIISGGVNVYPREVEMVLTGHPAVVEAAVIGVADEVWGERVHAVVVTRTAVTEEALLTHCRGQLAGPKRPRSVSFCAALPRTPTGKIRRSDLL